MSARSNVLIPSSYLPYIFNTCAAVSIVPILAGTYGILSPTGAISALKFPRPTSPAIRDQKILRGFIRMYSVRQASMGLCTLAMWWTGSRRALGLSYLAGFIVALTDGVVAKEVTGEHVAGHWIGVGLSLFFAGTLLGFV